LPSSEQIGVSIDNQDIPIAQRIVVTTTRRAENCLGGCKFAHLRNLFTSTDVKIPSQPMPISDSDTVRIFAKLAVGTIVEKPRSVIIEYV
jgi:hypothetical protein